MGAIALISLVLVKLNGSAATLLLRVLLRGEIVTPGELSGNSLNPGAAITLTVFEKGIPGLLLPFIERFFNHLVGQELLSPICGNLARCLSRWPSERQLRRRTA